MTHENPSVAGKTTIFSLILELAAEHGYQGAPPPEDLPLCEIGFDSLLTIQLVAALEARLGIEIPDSALSLESFATIESTTRVVERLL